MTRDFQRPRVNRRLLQQALQEGQQISRAAITGQGFDPRGGVGTLVAQLATAGIGAYAQNKARKQMAELEQQEQATFAEQFPQFAGLAGQLTPETRQAVIQKQLMQQFERPSPQSAIGKIQSDIQAGLITPEQGQLAIQKATATKPLVEVKTGEVETQFQKERGKGKAARLQEIVEAGDRATSFDINLDQIEQALEEGAFIGPGAGKIATINEISAVLGLPADLESAANTRKIQQRVGDLTLQATGKLKGAISEKELKLAERTVFDIGTSELATRKAIETLRTLTSYDQQLSDLASQLESEGRFTTDFRKEKKRFDREFRKNLVDQINSPLQQPATQRQIAEQEITNADRQAAIAELQRREQARSQQANNGGVD